MMRSITRNEELGEEKIVYYPEGIGTLRGIEEREYFIRNNFLHGITRETLLEGMNIIHRDVRHHREIFFEVDHNYPFLKMQFEIEGYSSYRHANRESLDVDILNGCHQLFFFPEVRGRLRYPACRRYTVEILLSLDYFKKVFHNDLTSLNHFGSQVENNAPVTFFPACLPLTPAMRQGLTDIVCCPLTGVFREIYLKSKVLELLMLQVGQYSTLEYPELKPHVGNHDIEKLYYVKELLTCEPDNAYSLHEISKLAGLNDFKLKKGFKELFHNTVFGYLTEVRMEKAKTMILESNYSIAEVAHAIGYKNPQHFTASFKRKFGYLPSSLRIHHTPD